MVLLSKSLKRTNASSSTASDLSERARAALNADDDTAVSVTEHACADPECCGARTIVMIMRPRRRTEAVKIDKPIEQVTPADLSDALAPFVAGASAAKSEG